MTELRRVGRHAATTADELRAFLRELKGRSPKEMLGTVASSSLARSLCSAAIGAAVLVTALTIIPFAWHLATSADGAPESRTAPERAGTAPSADPADGRIPAPEPAANADTTPPSRDAIEKLGLGEERTAPSTVNPLDEANDNLLKGLD